MNDGLSASPNATAYCTAKAAEIHLARCLALEGAAPDRFTLWTSYRITSGILKGLRFGGGVIHARGPIQQFGVSANRLVAENGYTELNAFTRYETRIADRKVSLGLNVNNLTNVFYYAARATSNKPRHITFSTTLEL